MLMGLLSWFKEASHRILHLSWRVFSLLESQSSPPYLVLLLNRVLRFSSHDKWDCLTPTILQDFGITAPTPTLLYCDNQAVIHIASNLIFHECTKDTDIECHFVHKVNEGSIKLNINLQTFSPNLFHQPYYFLFCSRWLLVRLEGSITVWSFKDLHYRYFYYFIPPVVSCLSLFVVLRQVHVICCMHVYMHAFIAL